MADEIKSASEIAREKIEKLGQPTEEERLRWKYTPEGERFAAKYLADNVNLATELAKFEEKARPFVVAGAQEILLRNLGLPRNDSAKRNSKKAMDGLRALKNDKVRIENVYSRMRRIFDHYAGQGEMQRKQAYESLKLDFEAKVQQALKQQIGAAAGLKIDIESQPQFREEWRKLLGQLDSQYERLLRELKQELMAIP
jgi:hypothetical protein